MSGATSSLGLRDKIDIALEEYKTLRTEVTTSIGTQQSILTFGTAALGLVVAAGFDVWTDHAAAALVFVLVVPLVSSLVLMLWSNEVVRLLRAAYFVGRIERKVNANVGEEILTWEKFVHGSERADWGSEPVPPRRLRDIEAFRFVVVTILYGVVAAAGIAAGIYQVAKLDERENLFYGIGAASTLVTALALGTAVWVYFERRRFTNATEREDRERTRAASP